MKPTDWDPHGPDVRADQRTAYDDMRARCPVAYDASGGWTLFRHEDVVRVLHDHETFSNVVSRHPSVPNGMDPPVHGPFRRLVDTYFTDALVAAFEPTCRDLAARLVDAAVQQRDVDVMTAIALPFAASAQCAYLGWPPDLAAPLVEWTRRNHAATLAGDRDAHATIARELEAFVAGVIDRRRAERRRPPVDLTDRLIRETVDGRRLTLVEMTSLLRNWTMGEVGTIAASVGIVAVAIATDQGLQHQLRWHLQLLPASIDELLRLHGPLLGNRRVTTRPVVIGDREIDAGSRVTINWVAANRDPETFTQAGAFRLDRDPADNLLYGAGIHVCPGAALARLELRVLVEELLAATCLIETIDDRPFRLALPPASGYAEVPLHLVHA
ncbi:MAG: cytochrome [Acidobacteria bacterium SCN 69-37]|nr:MAG: cytochrome [Acidobacteria bacterium SCN 69-37]